MSQLKGFAVYAAGINNTRAVVAPVGEISLLSLTQTREHTIHNSSTYPGVTLVSFYFLNTAGQVVVPPADVTNQIIMISDWVYTQMTAGRWTADASAFRESFNTAYGTAYDLGHTGAMVANGDNFAPEYITFSPKSQGYEWRIWFADQAFQTQFDEIETVSVPPVSTVDRFMDTYSAVLTLVNSVDPIEVSSRIDLAKGVNPPTNVRVDRFDWVNPQNPAQRIPTYWYTVVYGMMGDSFEQAKATHREHILSHSQYTAEQWAEVFPSMFTSAEMIVVPMYHRVALENMNRDTGIFSAIVDHTAYREITLATCKGTGYTAALIDSRIEHFPTHYRSLMCSAVTGSDNVTALRKFSAIYPDYANIPPTDHDIGKMSNKTINFILKLEEMFETAEFMTNSSSVPPGYSKIVRDGVLYLGASYDDYLLLVVSKQSVDQAAGL